MPTLGTAAPGATATLDEVTARAVHTATTLANGAVFVAGGCVTDGCSRASADTFILGADGASILRGPSLAGPRDGQTATLVGDGNVVLVGGYSGEGQSPLATIEIFHSTSRELEAVPPMNEGRGGHAAAALGDGTVLIVGGWIRPRTPTAAAVIFDPQARSVSQAADLPITTDGLDAVTLSDGRVLVTGGLVESGLGTDQAFIYDASTGEWRAVGPMVSPRFKHASVLLDDGRVLVIGGTTDDRQLLATTEIFDPASSTFSAGPDLVERRYKMSGGAVVIDGHRVVVAGGGRTVEILDLRAGTSQVVETFGGRGSFATINQWGSDSLLVLGGYDDRIALRREFHVFRPSDTL